MFYLFRLKINKFIKKFFSLFYKEKCTRPSDVFRTPTWPIDIGHTICPGLTPLLWVYLLMSYMVNTTLLDRIKSFWLRNQTRRTRIFQTRRYIYTYVLIFLYLRLYICFIFCWVLHCSTGKVFTYRLCFKKYFGSNFVEFLVLIHIMSFILQISDRVMQRMYIMGATWVRI